MSLTLASLFDGIGGWQLAAIRAGVKPLWSSEIERFPLAVTKTRFPNTKQLGDITKINIDEIEPVDIICAGSPCQDLSVANSSNRKGLSGERSGLFKIAVNIVRRMRERTNGKYPRFFVWENVCGAFSTGYDDDGNKMRGADFRAVLESLTEASIPMPTNNRWADAGLVQCDGVNVGWRVLNASGWGVPQRRKRIFLVASFGQYSAAEVLFVEKGLYGDIEESRRKESTAAESIKSGAGEPSFCNGKLITYNVENVVSIRKHKVNTDGLKELLKKSLKECGMSKKHIAERLNKPLTQIEHYFRTDGYFAIPEPEVWYELKKILRIETDEYDKPITEFIEAGNSFDSQNRIYDASGISPTLTSTLAKKTTFLQNFNEVYDVSHRMDVIRKYVEKAPTLEARMGTGGGNVPIIFEPGVASRDGGHIYTDGKAPTLRANPDDNAPAVVVKSELLPQYTVRRLTPTEAERIQGLPDNWTLIDDKSCSDAARFKAIGNGMAQPCADFIIRQIVGVTEK